MAQDWIWRDLIAATNGKTVAGVSPDHVTGISTDSRSIRPGELFVALRGERFDGHEFLQDAWVAGAAAALVDELYMDQASEVSPLPLIVVKDTLQGYGALARYHRRRCGASVVAVTGSVGKSSTRRMVAEILRTRLRVHEAEKNYNNLVGTPKTLLALTPGVDVAVLEHGIDRPGEMARLASISQPDVGVILSIAPCHLERLGSLEGIAREKGLLLLSVGPGGWGVINLDTPFASYFQALSNQSLCYSIRRPAPVWADSIQTDLQARPRFTVRDPHGQWECELSIPGRHQVFNALAAWCVGEVYEVPPSDRVKALAAYRGTWGRLNPRPGLKGTTILDDVYNSNPASARAALETLSCSEAGRRVAVVGDMLELGPRAEEYHRELGLKVPSFHVDLLITLGSLARHVAQGAVTAGMSKERVIACERHGEVVERLTDLMEEGDLILVKASRGMEMEKVVDQIALPEEG